MEPLLTSSQARAYLQISRATLDRACEQYRVSRGARGLPHIQRGAGTHRKFRRADLDHWAAGGTPVRRLRAAS